MAMVDVVSWQPTGGPVAQVHWLDPKVSSCLVPFCIHCVNRAMILGHDACTVNIVPVLL